MAPELRDVEDEASAEEEVGSRDVLGTALERGVIKVLVEAGALERIGINVDLGVGMCIALAGCSNTRPSADT